MSTKRVLSSMLLIAVATLFVVLSVGPAPADPPSRIPVCHRGNTLELNVHAVAAHLEHGDLLGPCGGEPGCPCGNNFDPVTCADGQTYANQCYAECSDSPGPCTRIGLCSNIWDPVRCDGVIYANECQAALAGCDGPIEVLCVCGNIYAPVRCADGTIYANQCIADCQDATGCAPLE